MKKGRNSVGGRILIIVCSCFLLLLIGFLFTVHILIPKKFKQQLLQLPPEFEIHYSGMHTNLFASAITLENVDVTITPDKNRKDFAHRLHFSKLRFNQVNYLKIAISKNLVVSSVELDSANIFLDSFLLAHSDSMKIPSPTLFGKLSIKQIQMPAAKIYSHTGTANNLIAAGDISLFGLRNINSPGFTWENLKCDLSNLSCAYQTQRIEIKKFYLDSRYGEIKIDSALYFAENKLAASVAVASANNFELSDSNLKIEEISLDHPNFPNPDILKNLPHLALKTPPQIQVDHLKASHVQIENADKSQASGKLETWGLVINQDSLARRPISFSDLLCEFSNINLPFQSGSLSAKYFNLDSKKRKLRVEDFKIENGKGAESIIEMIALNDFDIANLLNKKLIAGELSVGGIKSNITTNNFFQSTGDASLFVKINNVNARNIDVQFKNKNNSFSCTADLHLEGLLVENLNKNFDPDSLRFASLQCDLSDIRTSIPGEMHNIQIDKLSMDSRQRMIEITSLKTMAEYSKDEYGKRRGVQGNWVKANVPHIKILDADISALTKQKLIADKMIVGGSDIYVYRDRRLPRKLRNQKLPVEYMKGLPFDIRINTVTIEPSRVVYEEFPNAWIRTGILRLEKMKMTLSPFINHPLQADPAYMHLNASGSVMGSGTATAYFEMPLRDNGLYYVKGRFENLSLPTLNSTAENLGDFSIKSGLLNFLNFEFTMSAERAKGKIVGEYHDLVVDKIKIDRNDSTRKEKAGFSSFMVHHVVIPKNKDISMPERKRTGKVDYPRDPTRFVTYYFIKALLDGVRSSFTFGFVLPK